MSGVLLRWSLTPGFFPLINMLQIAEWSQFIWMFTWNIEINSTGLSSSFLWEVMFMSQMDQKNISQDS